MPFCLFEIRMSPQLHKCVYGSTSAPRQTFRWGGFRPMVFMQRGLAVGIWMIAGVAVGMWLWVTGA